jgi:hypothetical protein
MALDNGAAAKPRKGQTAAMWVAWVRQAPTVKARAERCAIAMDEMAQAMAILSALRGAAIIELCNQHSQREVARMLGLSPTRVGQMLTAAEAQ